MIVFLGKAGDEFFRLVKQLAQLQEVRANSCYCLGIYGVLQVEGRHLSGKRNLFLHNEMRNMQCQLQNLVSGRFDQGFTLRIQRADELSEGEHKLVHTLGIFQTDTFTDFGFQPLGGFALAHIPPLLVCLVTNGLGVTSCMLKQGLGFLTG